MLIAHETGRGDDPEGGREHKWNKRQWQTRFFRDSKSYEITSACSWILRYICTRSSRITSSSHTLYLRMALNASLRIFHRFFVFSDTSLLHRVAVVSLSQRMRREPLAQVTALLKTMKQTLYERGYGANYLAISRASNKWASPRTSLFLSLCLSLPFAPPSSALFVFSTHLLRSFLRRGPTSPSSR